MCACVVLKLMVYEVLKSYKDQYTLIEQSCNSNRAVMLTSFLQDMPCCDCDFIIQPLGA